MLNFFKKVWNWLLKTWVKIVLFILAVLLIVFVLIPVGAKLYRIVRNWTDEDIVTNLVLTDQVVTNPADTVGTNTSSTILDLGIYGSYKAVFDSNLNTMVIGWWEKAVVRVGSKNLADLKRDGGTISFPMPFSGWINNSAGELYVDGLQWDLGNYAESQENTIIKKGQVVTISYQPQNDSAGFMLIADN